MKIVTSVLVTIVLIAAAALGLVYSGAFNVAASEPDSAAVHWLMETIRERSIESRLDAIEVPPLGDPALVAEGAEHYDAMCAVCHVAPGGEVSEIRAGLNPKPPNLVEHGAHDLAETFWVIKHGIKMTGMPAWGETHDDQTIWGIVAFVQALPELSPEAYRSMIAQTAGGHAHGERPQGAESGGDESESEAPERHSTGGP
ncbi:MAG: c-type cytochrome [Gammaproteobacteria bacterium]